MNFGMRGDNISDKIAQAKFCDNRFSVFGVLISPILPFSIGFAGRPYKFKTRYKSTTMLHWDLYVRKSMEAETEQQNSQRTNLYL